MLDPLGVVTKTRTAIDDKEEGPAEAPSTIIGREDLLKQNKTEYFYMPGMGEVPEMELPNTLPELAGMYTYNAQKIN